MQWLWKTAKVSHTYLPEASYPFPVSVSVEPSAHAPTASSPLQEACPEGLYNVLFLFSFYLGATNVNAFHFNICYPLLYAKTRIKDLVYHKQVSNKASCKQ